MLRIGLIGFGFMGRMHFDNYTRLMREGAAIELAAICDVRIEELKNGAAQGNIATEQAVYDLSPYRLYDDITTMVDGSGLILSISPCRRRCTPN